ncbi:MAG TPA: hypothetical protein VFW73_10105 [Lacipirellulaceae bacterium]|nr:hypothetical protein [Lacipirellulaceae bacterium]
MRLPLSFRFASLVCLLSLAASGRLAVAQNEAGESTIRLASGTEFVRDTTAQLPPRVEERVDYQVAPAEYPSQPARESSVDTSVRTVSYEATQPTVSRPRMPAEFKPSAAARAVLSEMPRPMPVEPAPLVQAPRRGGKPFNAVQSQPTISPYLYLNAGTPNSSPMTNYFAFVRPQLEQQQAAQQQQHEMQQLRAQMQKLSSGGGMQTPAESNVSAHFMDTGQFYRRWQR